MVELNRLVFTIELGALRYLGFIPDDLSKTPSVIVKYLAHKLNLNPKGLKNYQPRPNTRSSQLQQIREFLGWRKPTSLDFLLWEKWLLDRAMEHDRPSLLFQLLCDKLRVEKIVRPAVTTLERMVIDARVMATTETSKRLQFLLTTATVTFLDSLLVIDEKIGLTPLTWLRRHATTNSPNSILNALKKLTFLEEQNVLNWDLSCLNPNRIKFLASLASKSSNHALKKTSEEKRYPILVAFVSQIYSEVTDENKRKIPNDATQDFIPPKWKNYVFDEKGNIVRRYYEMCLLWELRRALRSGDIWLDNSRRYANPESYLISSQKWSSLRPEVCQILQLPKNGKDRLQQQREALDYQLEKLHQTINDNDKVRMDENKDAPYLLDAILDNETELSILEHTTDTAGYSDVMFALFDLLGLQFSPRLKALKSKCLYLINKEIKYPNLKPLFKGKIRTEYILNRWDDLLRVVGSLKLGWVTSSLFIGKLQSFPQQNGLLGALEEYGRLVKTNFILRYLNSEDYRRRINTQLNKGEKLHDLRRFLFFAHQGFIRQSQDENLANQSTCLTLVTNAVVAWNTVYMQEVISQLKLEGREINEADFVHLSPARFKHINPYGRYEFDVAKTFSTEELRPLRKLRKS